MTVDDIGEECLLS